ESLLARVVCGHLLVVHADGPGDTMQRGLHREERVGTSIDDELAMLGVDDLAVDLAAYAIIAFQNDEIDIGAGIGGLFDLHGGAQTGDAASYDDDPSHARPYQ